MASLLFESKVFETKEKRFIRNINDADGYHARACQFALEDKPASLVFNVASIAIECYLIALCAYFDVMPFNHNYGCLMNAAEEALPDFPQELNKQIRSLDTIFGICSLDNYHHGTPEQQDADNTLAICHQLVELFAALEIIPPADEPF